MSGVTTIEGTQGNDSIGSASSNQNQYIFGLGGDDTLTGGQGTDTIIGGAGADLIFSNNGADVVIGGIAQFDSIGNLIGVAEDSVSDTISSGQASDKGYAGMGDYLDGGQGAQDMLYVPTGYTSVTGASVTVGGTTYDQIFTDTAGHTIFATNWEFVSTYSQTTLPCFASGTKIATARGEVAVEDLRVGDLVVCAGGRSALQPVMWIGHSEVNVAKHARPEAVQPILIKAGALAKGVPFRDLRVSPDHAMLLDGQLVPAGLLVNGTSIVREAWCPRVTYWHVELPMHAVLLAEGAAAESYLDDGNRKHFDNGGIAMLFKDFASERANGVYDRTACYPVLRQGPALEAIRAKLDQRSEALDQPKVKQAG